MFWILIPSWCWCSSFLGFERLKRSREATCCCMMLLLQSWKWSLFRCRIAFSLSISAPGAVHCYFFRTGFSTAMTSCSRSSSTYKCNNKVQKEKYCLWHCGQCNCDSSACFYLFTQEKIKNYPLQKDICSKYAAFYVKVDENITPPSLFWVTNPVKSRSLCAAQQQQQVSASFYPPLLFPELPETAGFIFHRVATQNSLPKTCMCVKIECLVSS